MSEIKCILTLEKRTLVVDFTSLFGTEMQSNDLTIKVLDNGNPMFENYTCGSADGEVKSHLFINGVRFSELKQIGSDETKAITRTIAYPPGTDRFIATVSIEPDSIYFASGDIILSIGDHEVNVNISDNDTQTIDTRSFTSNQLDMSLETYLLIRTNPKLSGNIKLVVDSEYRLYLDTLKDSGSSMLNDRVYRKYPISSEGNYPFDVMTVFSSLPKGELFKLPKDSLNPHKNFNNYKNQFFTNYEYGAETNTDNLYPENMKILAPLHIGKNIPDFFTIFRYDRTFNEETYNSVDIDDTEKLTTLLKESEVVKIFDLRTYTSIGQYLNNYKKYIKDFLYGSCHLQFIEQDNEKYGQNYRQGNNSWRGIAIDKGIITNKIETSYFGNNILTSDTGVQERFDEYIINGYERNNILYPYIINLEFMFNDEKTEEYSMHRYFGLYLSANSFLNYDCIVTDNHKGNNVVHKYDKNDNEIYDSGIIGNIFNKKFSDRIFFMTTNNDATRIQNTDDVKKFITNYVLDNPDRNICNVRASKVEWEDEDKSFITLNFSEPISYGEHLRFIALDYYNERERKFQNNCLEIIASNDERLVSTDYNISPYIYTNEPLVSNTENSTTENNIYRLSFYTQDLADSSKPASLPEQLSRIRHCIDKFDQFVKVESMNDNTIGISSMHDKTFFQHIAKMHKYEEPAYEKLYMKTENGTKKLFYTGEQSIANNKSSYIIDIKDALGYADENCIHIGQDNSESNAGNTVQNVFYSKDNLGSNGKIATYVEYKSNEVKDTIRYFSKTYDSHMHPLSPDSYYFYSKFSTFSTFGFDILGWRYSNIVEFKKISDFKHPYVIYDDIESVLKVVRHPLTKCITGQFETMNKIGINTGYLTDNVLLLIGNDKKTQKLKFTESEYNLIVCPYNVNKTVIDFAIEPLLVNYMLGLYNPESADLCVMGIFNVKDMDLTIDMDQSERIRSSNQLFIKSGDTVFLNNKTDDRILHNVVYKITSGAFNEFSATKFVIIGDTLYTSGSDDSVTNISTIEIYKGTLTAATDVKMEICDSNCKQFFDYVKNIPQHLSKNFYVNSDESRQLNISIVPQANCIWDSNGQYFDGNNSLNVDDMVSNVPYKMNGYFIERGFSQSGSVNPNMFVKNSLDSFLKIGTDYHDFREVIRNNMIKNPLKSLLIQNTNINPAVGYYNSFVQSLEFIFYGIKFNIKFNSEYYNQNLRIGEYNNFEVFVINDYDRNKNNEIVISADEEIIIVINHQFSLYGDDARYSQVKAISDTNISATAPYSATQAPYSLKAESVFKMPNNGSSQTFTSMLASKTGSGSISKTQETAFVQIDKVSTEYVNNLSILPSFMYFSTTNYNDNNSIVINSGDTYMLDATKDKSNNIAYNISKYPVNNTDVDLLAQKHRKTESFVINNKQTSDSKSIDSSELIDKYIQSFDENYDCYVISNGKCENIRITNTYKPITVSLSIPNQIKYNFGYFTPRTYDIINFKTNDYELADTIDMSMLLGNTKVDSVNKIRCYTGNKVFDTKIETSIDKNYFITESKSPFASNWDKNYYRKYNIDSQENYSGLNGYLPGIEDKSFFGSKCMTLKNKFIKITDFSDRKANKGDMVRVDSQHNVLSENENQYRFTINITQALYTLFQSNTTFTDNWIGFTSGVDTSIKNYIKSTISEIFNNQRKCDVVIDCVNDNSTEQMQITYSPFEASRDGVFNIDNFHTEASIENEDFLITITVGEMKHTVIHPYVKIYRYN